MPKEARSLVFLGTPEAAATVLQRLIAERFHVAHVVTRPDARRGRGAATSPSPVKKIAHEHGIDVSHSLEWLTTHKDQQFLGVVVAYGRIIPASVLNHTPMINVHFSLLPRWRGAAPVERAILAGDEKTGVCIMDLEETLDTGAVHSCVETIIQPTHTTDSLTAELAELGAQLLVDTLQAGLSRPTPQEGETTYAEKIRSDELRIDWRDTAENIHRKIRALRSYTTVDGARLRILDAVCAEDVPKLDAGQCGNDAEVGTGSTPLRLITVQPEGKRPMSGRDWLRGRQGEVTYFDISD